MRWLFVLAMASFMALLTAPTVAVAQEQPGVLGSRYVSPQFGYALEWDDAWQVDRALSRPGFDALVLTDGTSDVVLSATTGYAGATGLVARPEQCVKQSLGALMARPGTQSTVRQDDTGEPRQAVEGNLFWMVVGYDAADGTAMTAYISCRGLGLDNGAMQTFIHLAAAGEYDAEEIAVDALLESYQAPWLDLIASRPGCQARARSLSDVKCLEGVLRLVNDAVPGTAEVTTTSSLIGTRGSRASGGQAHSSRRRA